MTSPTPTPAPDPLTPEFAGLSYKVGYVAYCLDRYFGTRDYEVTSREAAQSFDLDHLSNYYEVMTASALARGVPPAYIKRLESCISRTLAAPGMLDHLLQLQADIDARRPHLPPQK